MSELRLCSPTTIVITDKINVNRYVRGLLKKLGQPQATESTVMNCGKGNITELINCAVYIGIRDYLDFCTNTWRLYNSATIPLPILLYCPMLQLFPFTICLCKLCLGWPPPPPPPPPPQLNPRQIWFRFAQVVWYSELPISIQRAFSMLCPLKHKSTTINRVYNNVTYYKDRHLNESTDETWCVPRDLPIFWRKSSLKW